MNRAAQLRLQALAAAAVALIAAMQLTLNDSEVRVRGRLGPTPGPNSLGHVQGKRAYLERVAVADPQRRASALVSFSKFISAEQARSLVSGMRATVVFVRMPQSEPDALHLMKPLGTTVAAAVEELAILVRAEIASISKQLESSQGEDRQHLETSLAERQRSLAALVPECPCVYAVAVQDSSLGALARLQKDPRVLLVDVPEPVEADLAGWELTPILPAVSS